jgi:hypothetical protein
LSRVREKTHALQQSGCDQQSSLALGSHEPEDPITLQILAEEKEAVWCGEARMEDDNTDHGVLEENCAICCEEFDSFCKTTPTLLLGPRREGIFDHGILSNHGTRTIQRCKKNDFFYQSTCYPLRLLKNLSGHHFR